jgi:hypothetical protein
MLAKTSKLAKSAKFMIANKMESKAPAKIQYLRKIGRLLNLLVTDEMVKADKTKLAKLIATNSNREFPPKCEVVAAACR